ncbi:MAG: 1-(5-phosphoribosyl)-5-[(5-phosphoribosylamino)methylideneamino]imidazole-4-carboxamide isomerase [Acutalibacteraceae bacterium]|nr:1-(5-phosphoribosyl)-5-[(5-phosphoribosylamino)methylideneamino]imidazole-4-carboxamide isomerase [Acutalibacteraceae bacterium]
MIIYPAIDLYEGKAVRLFKGDYNQMTVYSENPLEIALDFEKNGATHIHMVDLEGAKTGTTPNFETVVKVKNNTSLFCEIGGGIRSMEVIDRYISAGVDRVILGTAAVTSEGFVKSAVEKYGDKIAVGIDIKDGFVAIKGWTEKSGIKAMDFAREMEQIGVKTLICTDISKDGAMEGTNHDLYKELSEKFGMQIIASGGVSSIDDVKRLSARKMYGAIIGKAYYTGAINLKEAIEVAE